MSDLIVLLHGSGTGSSSWMPIAASLAGSGASVVAPDLLGYGRSPPPGSSYGIAEEVSHLLGLLDRPENGTIHLVTHSFGSLIGLHLRRALGSRVTRMTLIEPVIVSVLRERHEDAAYAEMEEQYQRFMSFSDDHEAAAAFLVNHWSGAGAWESIGKRGRDLVASLVPKFRLEMIATRSDTTKLAWFAESPCPMIILVGEKTLLAPRAVARQLQSALRAALVIVPGAAHMIPITHPHAILDAIRMERIEH
jgi:pimeloyl-ACP methyl ester carboxylesterase